MADDITKSTLEEAMDELETLEKSLSDENQPDETDDLEKSAKEAEEALKKSDDKDADDKGKKEDDKEEEDDKKDMEKSDVIDLEDELIKASEAYASLEKSVQEGISGVQGEVSSIKEAVASTTDLLKSVAGIVVKQAKVIASLTKSVKEMGRAPVATSEAKIGVGTRDEMKKSSQEVKDALEKAVDEGKVEARCLSLFGSRGVDALPDDVKAIIGYSK